MSIATEITKLQNNLSNAYNAIQKKGGTIPTQKTMANLSSTIASIKSGGYDLYDLLLKRVTEINDSNSKIKVTAIMPEVFKNCTKLSAVSFPSCEYIQELAFCNCSSLISADFGNSLTSINNYGFQNCSNLSTINGSKLKTLGTCAFIQSGIVSADFPELTSMKNHAFWGCKNLTSFNAPNLVRIESEDLSYEGVYMFYNTDLREVLLPNLTTIDSASRMFVNNTNLTKIDLPELSSDIKSDFIQTCTSLTSVNLPKVKRLCKDAFKVLLCPNATEFNISSVEYIENGSIGSAYPLEELYLPNLISSENLSLYVLSKVKKITIGNKLTHFGSMLIVRNVNEINLSSVTAVPVLTGPLFSKIGPTTYSIYVPQALYNDFCNATNWSTVSSHIVAVPPPMTGFNVKIADDCHFGLDDPSYYITLTDNNGVSKTWRGNEAPAQGETIFTNISSLTITYDPDQYNQVDGYMGSDFIYLNSGDAPETPSHSSILTDDFIINNWEYNW